MIVNYQASVYGVKEDKSSFPSSLSLRESLISEGEEKDEILFPLNLFYPKIRYVQIPSEAKVKKRTKSSSL